MVRTCLLYIHPDAKQQALPCIQSTTLSTFSSVLSSFESDGFTALPHCQQSFCGSRLLRELAMSTPKASLWDHVSSKHD